MAISLSRLSLLQLRICRHCQLQATRTRAIQVQSWMVTITSAVIFIHVQAALLAGRTNKALVGREEFSQAVLRSVAGIEKKRSILQGLEKDVVARHEVRTVSL